MNALIGAGSSGAHDTSTRFRVDGLAPAPAGAGTRWNCLAEAAHRARRRETSRSRHRESNASGPRRPISATEGGHSRIRTRRSGERNSQGGDVQRTRHAQRPGERPTTLGELEAANGGVQVGTSTGLGPPAVGHDRTVARDHTQQLPRGHPRPAADTGPDRAGHRVRPAPRRRARRPSRRPARRPAQTGAEPSPRRGGCRCASRSAGPRAGRSALPCRSPARAGSRAP